MVQPWFPVRTYNILMIFRIGYITMYLAHAVSPRRLVHCISTLPGIGQFFTLLPLVKRLSLSTPGNVGYSDRLMIIQMVYPLLVHCVSFCRIVGVVSEVVACTHVWYCPMSQHMHVLCRTYQMGTRSLGVARMRLGVVCNPTTRTISPQNIIMYPVVE